MNRQVKICGLSTPQTIECAIGAGADFIGLVFYKPSPRNVDIETGAKLAELARGRSKIVALTVDADDQLLEQITQQVMPDYLQAQGGETPERIADITGRYGTPVIKSIKVGDAKDVQKAGKYADVAAMALFDAKAPETLVNALPGGNGLAFDWSLLGADGRSRDFMLAGGLNAGNIADAIAATGAPIIDVSSGVEIGPGKKDCDLIRNFIEAAKAAS